MGTVVAWVVLSVVVTSSFLPQAVNELVSNTRASIKARLLPMCVCLNFAIKTIPYNDCDNECDFTLFRLTIIVIARIAQDVKSCRIMLGLMYLL